MISCYESYDAIRYSYRKENHAAYKNFVGVGRGDFRHRSLLVSTVRTAILPPLPTKNRLLHLTRGLAEDNHIASQDQNNQIVRQDGQGKQIKPSCGQPGETQASKSTKSNHQAKRRSKAMAKARRGLHHQCSLT